MTRYNDQAAAYVTDLFAVEDDALHRILVTASERGLPDIGIAPEEGRFLQFLVRACGAVKALEFGTLGGYSGTWIARGLAPGGRLITVEKEPKHAEVARENFVTTGVADRVEVRVGDAQHMLPALEGDAPFDFVFIDAEKEGYPAYYEWAVRHVRLNGVIAAHNAFGGGAVFDPNAEGYRRGGAVAVRELTRRVSEDERVLATIYPAGDGTLVAVRIK
ncbi:MAG: O-methyltransferase [Anaerolineae bacterium]